MKGLDKFVFKLENLTDAVKQGIKDELENTMTDIEIGAIRMAPVGIGQKIQKTASNSGYTQTLTVNAGKIAAYIEFGTGQSAAELVPTLPDEWQDIARRFYINGQGRLIASPYIYPNWIRYTAGLGERLTLVLEKAKNK